MRIPLTTARAGTAALITAALALGCGGGGGGGTPSTTTGPSSGVVAGSIGAIINITANGLNPADVRIEPTQRVRYVNQDTRPHEIQTNPHNFHTDCPPNNIRILNPGQSIDTEVFSAVKACGYHDHLLPDEQRYWGVIRVGTNDDNRGPVYSRGW
jgi:plastocyanin